MAATNKVLVDGVQLTASAAVLYTSPENGAGTRVTAFSLINNVGTTQTYSLYIVPSGGAADASTQIVSSRSLTNNDTDIPLELINQLVPAGGTIMAVSSLASAISVRASGIEFT